MQCISFLLFFLYVLRQKAVTSCPFLLIDMMGQAELELHFLDNFLSRLFFTMASRIFALHFCYRFVII